jgi:hypothetical protein
MIFTVRLVVSTLGGLVVLFGAVDLQTSVPAVQPVQNNP